MAKSRRCWDGGPEETPDELKVVLDELLHCCMSCRRHYGFYSSERVQMGSAVRLSRRGLWSRTKLMCSRGSVGGVWKLAKSCIVYRHTHALVNSDAWTRTRPAAVMYIVSTSIPHSHIFPYLSPPQDYTAGSLTLSLQKKAKTQVFNPPLLLRLSAPSLLPHSLLNHLLFVAAHSSHLRFFSGVPQTEWCGREP